MSFLRIGYHPNPGRYAEDSRSKISFPTGEFRLDTLKNIRTIRNISQLIGSRHIPVVPPKKTGLNLNEVA